MSQLSDLALHRLDLGALIRGLPVFAAAIDVGLFDPTPQRVVTTPLRPPAGSRRSDLRYVFNDVISDVSYAGVCDAWRNSWAGATAFVE